MLKKLTVVFFVLTSAIAVHAQDKDQQPDPISQKIAALRWEQGGSGAKGSIGSIASVGIPGDHGFLDDHWLLDACEPFRCACQSLEFYGPSRRPRPQSKGSISYLLECYHLNQGTFDRTRLRFDVLQ